jgi:Ca-activated chloride channel homolog
VIRLEHPLFLLLLAPLALAAWSSLRRRAQEGALPLPHLAALPAPRPGWRRALDRLAAALFPAGVALAIVALARPQSSTARVRRDVDAVAIAMVVDVSGSMAALDLSPRDGTNVLLRSRLDVVKDAFRRFVRERPDDLIGLIAFGGYASTLAPLTADHAALLHVLEGLEIPSSAPGGLPAATREEVLTAIGDALATACVRLRAAEPVSRAVVLLSDGESNTGIVAPEDAARAAALLGIRVYAIGVGSTGTAPFWSEEPGGRRVLRHARVTLDAPRLAALAADTGGRYFAVDDPRGLEEALRAIGRLETTRVQTTLYTLRRELFVWLLAPGLGLAAAGLALSAALSGRLP